jgi:hypothetical protein
MEQIKKKIENGYINFSDEVANKTFETFRKGYTKTITWGAIITDYKTIKEFERNYFDFVDSEVEATLLKKGNVINLRDEKKLCHKYSNTCDEYYLILKIDTDEITMENYASIAQAIKAQKKMNYRTLLEGINN